ncbi:hypothetical protein Patl1_00422 [Pistacia atlantica]|uniref:Uncharacterized protein n=1 Tax=Pistacia atlantica TaxID=434234 RepID=A0ACC1C780_9ROSI|nr:hypothetical protein Patl1_00422 [Pistacia atlantica]
MTKVRAPKEKGVENFGAVCSKLCALKECLKHWNKNVFGDVHSKVEKVRLLLAQVQLSNSQMPYTTEGFEEEIKAKQNLVKNLKIFK